MEIGKLGLRFGLARAEGPLTLLFLRPLSLAQLSKQLAAPRGRKESPVSWKWQLFIET